MASPEFTPPETEKPEPGSTLPSPSAVMRGSASEFPSTRLQPVARLAEVVPEPPERDLGVLGDYRLIQVLGRGAFATVYLARQVSLGRLVALKVSADMGSEARTLASLEHAHIVSVYSEEIHADEGKRLLCMQFVPGTDLARVIAHLDDRAWHGRDLLDAVNSLSSLPDRFDPAALRDRDELSRSDAVEAACWIGARLAEALAHAHGQGVLHRDVKPANILINPYGRPMLADFNLAFQAQTAQVGHGDSFGGTLAYMAPEHLDAFNPEVDSPDHSVDERSDVYALGVVLFELLTGHRPFPRSPSLAEMAETRRAGAPSVCKARDDLPETIDRVLRKCLDPDPARRFISAEEQAHALDGCRELQRIRKRLPPLGRVGQAALAHPELWLILLLFLPHVIGSVVNIAYNKIRIVDLMTDPQKTAFGQMLLAYNAVVYPICFWWAYRLIWAPLRVWRKLRDGQALAEGEAAEARRKTLSLPLWTVGLACLGWFPGGVVFPLGIRMLAGPIEPVVYARFLVSFWTSGLIALTYSFFSIQFMTLRVFYPGLWDDPKNLRSKARAELAGLAPRFQLFQNFAALIPLIAAALMVGLGPDSMTLPLRLLITSLIVLGMTGFGLAIVLSGFLARTLHVLTDDPGASTSP